MYFFTKWIFVVFMGCGLGAAIYFLAALKSMAAVSATLSIKKIRSALFFLIYFVLLAVAGFLELFIKLLGEDGIKIQILNNFLIGLIFMLFLLKLWKSITFNRK